VIRGRGFALIVPIKPRRNPMNKPEEIKKCPFCGAIPKYYDGDYVVYHKDDCFLAGEQEYWIVGKWIKSWNRRSG